MRRIALAAAVVVVLGGVMPTAGATFPGSNGRIIFRRYLNEAETRGAIFTIKPRGTRLRQVTRPRRGFVTTEPDWSPNGKWIAYHREEVETQRSRLFKIRRNGSDRKYLSGTCTGKCLGDSVPAWSPTGNRIAFQRELCSVGSNNLQAIYVMRADGTHARRVTHKSTTCAGRHPLADLAAQWAPGGKRLALERVNYKREKHAVFTIRLDGTGLKRITPWRIDASRPDWSPDGRWIAVASQEQSDTRGNIVLVRPDGSARQRITHSPGEAKWYSSSFSPNGKKITAALSPGVGEAGNADVYVMGTDGSRRRNVTSSGPWEGTPDWGPRRKSQEESPRHPL
ncbi:MAG: PD40 domain-containing protein [Actinobacteria bacterium]|nr:PD40 domain-containing protein [Actinomycetota bacterium]